MRRLHPIQFILLAFVLSACSLSPIFSSLPLRGDTPTKEAVETEPEASIEPVDVIQTPATAVPLPTPLPPEAIAKADAEELLLINLYERVNPSVVSIVVSVNKTGNNNLNDIFPTQGQGSGFVFDTEGHIITNNHVVADADKITVTFHDGLTAPAKVVGKDSDSDLAVVQVSTAAENLHPVSWANSDQLKVGQRAVAIGNPFALNGTLTTGIISALGRRLPTETRFNIPDIVQTDAAINPGNSGGPLLNSQGEVIGVNTAIVPRLSDLGERSFLGVGFAIPSNLVQRVVSGLIKTGKYEHPWIGFSGNTVNSEIATAMKLTKATGALVAEVLSGSPADKAGLRGATKELELEDGSVAQIGGDVITAIDDEAIKSFDDLISFLSRRGEVGKEVTLAIIRNGKEQKVKLTLEARPKAEGEK